MNIVVIIDDVAVDIYKKWSDMEKDHSLTKDDFTKHGDDYCVRMDLESYRVSKDIKDLETIATNKIFGKQKIDWLTAFATASTTVIAFLIFFG